MSPGPGGVGVLKVAVDSPLRGALDYLPPGGLRAAEVPVGVRVRVPLGRSRRTGIVLGHADGSDLAPARLRRVTAVLDRTPLLDAELLGFGRVEVFLSTSGDVESALAAIGEIDTCRVP